MLAIIDTKNMPLIKVEFRNCSDEDKKDQYFDNFLNEWTLLYSYGLEFMMVFDTRNSRLKPGDMRFVKKMACFMDTLKTKPTLLRSSIIVVSSDIVEKFLNILFSMNKPFSEVHVVGMKDFSNLRAIVRSHLKKHNIDCNKYER